MDGAAIFQGDAPLAGRPAAVDKVPPGAAPEREAAGPEALLGHGEIRDLFQNERGIAVRIDRARDGAEGLALGQQHSYDLIIAGLDLDGADGLIR